MNKLIFKEANEDRVVYRYYPNGGEAFGEVEYFFKTKESRVVRRSVEDDTGHFGHKAASKIKTVITEEDVMPRSFTQAWG